MEKVGIENVEKAMDLLVKNIKLGMKISKDGIDQSDLVYAPEAFQNLKDIIEFVAAKPSIVDELKDLDIAEGIELLKKRTTATKNLKISASFNNWFN